MRLQVISLSCLIFFLVSCTTSPAIVTTGPAIVTSIPATVTAVPTKSLSVPTQSPSQTSTSSIREGIEPALEGIQQTPDPTQMDISQWESTSPDENWTARGTYASPKSESSLGLDYNQLIIEDANKTIRWKVLETWRETGLGYTYTQPVKWSLDGKYFYFTNVPIVEGCKALQINGSDLQRVDLVNGNVQELLSNVAYSISLSPNESQLAYIMQGTGNLWIRNLSSGEEKEININPGVNFDAGNIAWSPDGQFLTLTLANLPCTGDYIGSGIYTESTSVLIVNSSTFEVRKMLIDDKRRFVTSAWIEENGIELINSEGKLWHLNVTTGTITQK